MDSIVLIFGDYDNKINQFNKINGTINYILFSSPQYLSYNNPGFILEQRNNEIDTLIKFDYEYENDKLIKIINKSKIEHYLNDTIKIEY